MFDETKNNQTENTENIGTDNIENDENQVVIDASPLFDENNIAQVHEDEKIISSDDYASESPVASFEWNSEPEAAPKKEKKKKETDSGKGLRVFLAAMISVFTLSVVTMSAMVIHYIVTDNNQQETIVTDNSSKQSKPYVTNTPVYVAKDFAEFEGKILSIPEIAAKCTPSSVGIVSEVEVSYNYPFYFAPSTRIAEASGSGFVYSSDGYIVTNHHVIEDATKITVILYDGTECEAKLVGSDSLSDVALLKIEVPEGVTLTPMELGDSDTLVVGEPVVAIGCPAGIEFIGTVTDGIISAINRDIEITDNNGSSQKVMTLIQTNATINHGNSGGPLINSRGEVIGINTLKLAQDYEGIGFSIPINGAVSIINQLIEHGKVVERTQDDFVSTKGIIGINGTEISEEEAEAYGIPKGVLVVQIDREGSAAKAGLRRGDIITHYNGKAVSSIADINAAKGNAKAGEQATITVYRVDENNKEKTFDITFNLDSQK